MLLSSPDITNPYRAHLSQRLRAQLSPHGNKAAVRARAPFKNSIITYNDQIYIARRQVESGPVRTEYLDLGLGPPRDDDLLDPADDVVPHQVLRPGVVHVFVEVLDLLMQTGN